MTKYDLIYEALQNQVDSGELTFETAEYLNDVAFEMYSDEELDGVEFTEAGNLQSSKEFKKKNKEFKKLSKEFKAAIKDGDKRKAKSIFKELKNIPDECAKILDDLNEGAISTILGIIVGNIRANLLSLLSAVLKLSGTGATIVGAANYNTGVTMTGAGMAYAGYGVEIGATVENIKNAISIIIGIIDDINKGTFSIDSFNLTRQKLKLNLNKLNKDLDKLYAMM